MANESRPKRWAKAVEKAQAALSTIESALGDFESACEDLDGLRQEYEEWRDNMNENLQSSALYEKLDEVANTDIDSAKDGLRTAFDDANDLIETAGGLDLPMGFGRD